MRQKYTLKPEIAVEIQADGGNYRLLETRKVYIDLLGKDMIIPKGFVTDFASVPRFFWRLLPPLGRYNLASLVHDFLYRTGDCTRAQADMIFYDLMEYLGVSYPVRLVMWLGVRVGGGRVWARYRER